jgi:hypothetical protein
MLLDRSSRRSIDQAYVSSKNDSGFNLAPFDPVRAVFFDFYDHRRTAPVGQSGAGSTLEIQNRVDCRDILADVLNLSMLLQRLISVLRGQLSSAQRSVSQCRRAYPTSL